MSDSNYLEQAILDHIFLNQPITNIGDASGLPASATEGFLYVSFHTADPGETGSPSNEATYTSYARVAVPRNASDWTRTGSVMNNNNNITAPASTGGATTAITHAAVYDQASGGNILMSAALSSPIPMGVGIAPQIDAGGFANTRD